MCVWIKQGKRKRIREIEWVPPAKKLIFVSSDRKQNPFLPLGMDESRPAFPSNSA